MAGLGRKVWGNEVISQPDLQGYLQDQVLMRFPGTAGRDGAIPAPSEGMTVYLDDVDRHLFHDGTAWHGLGAQPRAQMHAKTVQSSLTTGWQTIVLDGETVDTHAGHAPAGPGYTVPAGQGGQWEAAGCIGIGAMGGAVLASVAVGGRIRVNGADVVGVPPILMPVGSSGGCVVPFPAVELTLAAGDVVILQGFANTGGWSTLASGAGDTAGASTSRLRLTRLPS